MILLYAGIVGIVLGAASPVAVALTYLAVTFAYRSEKKMIVTKVVERLVLDDISLNAIAAAAHGVVHVNQPGQLQSAQKVATRIVWRCLSRWDGMAALRAKKDSNNRRSGIWMDKFETVRASGMLLAIQRTNLKILSESACKPTTTACI